MKSGGKVLGVYGAFSLAILGLFGAPALETSLEPGRGGSLVLFHIPLLGFAAAGFLGWRINQTRILFTSFLFLLVWYAMTHPGVLSFQGPGSPAWRQALGFSVPLSLFLIFVFPRNRFSGWTGWLRLLLPVLPLGGSIGWSLSFPDRFRELASLSLELREEVYSVPLLAVLSLGVFWAGAAGIRDPKIKPFFYSTGISLLPFLAATGLDARPDGSQDLPSLPGMVAWMGVALIQLHSVYRMFWERVYLDELTGIPNRRALDEYLETLSGEYAVAMMDVDHFKNFNDKYGHEQGDHVLRLVARTIQDHWQGKAFRYGGEEFCGVWEGYGSEDAYAAANKVRRKLEEREFHIRTSKLGRKKTNRKDGTRVRSLGKKVTVTLSVGLASPDSKHKTPRDVLQLADEALYWAKARGRNRVALNEEVNRFGSRKIAGKR